MIHYYIFLFRSGDEGGWSEVGAEGQYIQKAQRPKGVTQFWGHWPRLMENGQSGKDTQKGAKLLGILLGVMGFKRPGVGHWWPNHRHRIALLRSKWDSSRACQPVEKQYFLKKAQEKRYMCVFSAAFSMRHAAVSWLQPITLQVVYCPLYSDGIVCIVRNARQMQFISRPWTGYQSQYSQTNVCMSEPRVGVAWWKAGHNNALKLPFLPFSHVVAGGSHDQKCSA